MAKPRSPFAPRARARRRALQAIYQWQINDQSMRKILAQFEEEQDMGIVDRDYFEALLLGVEQHQETLDEALAEYLDRPMAQVDAIERASLRLAAFELCHRLDVPFKVILNEAVELAHDFGSEGGASYVNGVLDKFAARWREAEWQEGRKGG
ncbi:MAG: transcription antitermination factor NusB [Xanthomonadales bacterium]|nr:transcription antitermination factor NusB [Xanthomonadales bacterium]MCB1627852.1 transcription antitermination factor NusB [Xanthomonadales bacterium]MCB1641420.1 transcription antitermination factor NusB [Xanthomonadales bacterium]